MMLRQPSRASLCSLCLLCVLCVPSSSAEPDRQGILKRMQVVMGPLPDDSHKIPLDVKLEEEVRLEKFTRKKLTFAVEKGDRVPAYLLIPHERPGKVPAILCLHQTIAIGKGEPAGLG